MTHQPSLQVTRVYHKQKKTTTRLQNQRTTAQSLVLIEEVLTVSAVNSTLFFNGGRIDTSDN